MAVAPEIMMKLLELPESERADVAWRLLESVREGSDTDDLDEAEREQLHQALERSEADARSRRTRPVAALLEELHNLRGR